MCQGHPVVESLRIGFPVLRRTRTDQTTSISSLLFFRVFADLTESRYSIVSKAQSSVSPNSKNNLLFSPSKRWKEDMAKARATVVLLAIQAINKEVVTNETA